MRTEWDEKNRPWSWFRCCSGWHYSLDRSFDDCGLFTSFMSILSHPSMIILGVYYSVPDVDLRRVGSSNLPVQSTTPVPKITSLVFYSTFLGFLLVFPLVFQSRCSPVEMEIKVHTRCSATIYVVYYNLHLSKAALWELISPRRS
jgi:hypothetical protein